MEPMDEQQEEHFKKLIRETSTDAPSDAFTRAVMLRVHEEAAFRALVRQHSAEKPSKAFSSEIIAQIRASRHAAAPQPIAFRLAWYWIAAAWVALVAASFLIPGNEQQSVLVRELNGLSDYNQIFTGKVRSIPQPFMLTIIALSSLLLLDYFVRNKWVLTNKTARS